MTTLDLSKFENSELIKLSQQGDLSAFNVLVSRYRPEALNIAFRILGNRDDAEDACQNAWLSVWKAIKKYRGENFRAWELTIVTNACRYEYHKRKKRAELVVTDFPPNLESKVESDDIIAKEKLIAIHKSLLKLPYDQRLAIVLRTFSSLRYEEIAQVMHCSIGTIKSRISRAKINLRDILRREGLIT